MKISLKNDDENHLIQVVKSIPGKLTRNTVNSQEGRRLVLNFPAIISHGALIHFNFFSFPPPFFSGEKCLSELFFLTRIFDE